VNTYTDLAINDLDQFVFGQAPQPLTTRSGLVIGGGTVYPELNFTLPPMEIMAETMPEAKALYAEMIEGACARAVELHAPGLVVEFELLPPMTLNPEWGAEITAILRNTLDKYAKSDGLKSALRVTPNDIREHERPPIQRGGHLWDKMVRSFELNSQAGADLLSIESTGGKEVHDEAIVNADLPAATFALGVLGSRDMAYLWDMIVDVGTRNGAIPAGDSACGFGNTAMVLAEKRFIPRVWAATIRVMTVARALVAHERGAVGPGKDCAYENAYLKAITGYPMSGEGAEAACAHLSPVGNVARVTTDLWSNESVQHVKLLGGMTPTISVEQLIYAARLMNTASKHGPSQALTLRDWFAETDTPYDPQAYVLRPDVVLKLASEIVAEPTAYKRTRRAAQATLETLRKAYASKEFTLYGREAAWLNSLSAQADDLPEDEEQLIEQMLPQIDHSKVRLDQYEVSEKALA
jgi:methanol--5-hydroxybenzimidazolylcobamide Co-methyltransferase